MQTTANYGFKKPDGIETVNIEDLNYNADIMDQQLKSLDTAKASLASPTFTNTPAAPTAAAGTNTTQIANTIFVMNAIANLVNSSPAALDTLKELAAALGNDANFATTVTNALGLKAPLVSPSFTGSPTAPTAAAATNTTQVANTAFVNNALSPISTQLLEMVNDTGWIELPLLNGATAYNDSQKPLYRKLNKIVEIRGTIKGLTSTSNIQFATLPTGFIPSNQIQARCPLSGNNSWTVGIDSSGGIYGSGYSLGTLTGTDWMPFHIIFTIN